MKIIAVNLLAFKIRYRKKIQISRVIFLMKGLQSEKTFLSVYGMKRKVKHAIDINIW